jgi:hemolysin D
MDSPHRLPHEAQFLPAALALQETPVSPAPRIAMWLLIAFAFFAVLWAVFGKIDVVATAQGKIVPNERVKTIQPLETAVVTAIHVSDGTPVKTGDLLIELDSTSAAADTKRIESDLADAKLQAARSAAFIKGMDGDEPELGDIKGIDPSKLHEAQRLLASQWQEYRAKLERIEADISRKEAELRGTGEVVAKLEKTVPIAQDRAEVFS